MIKIIILLAGIMLFYTLMKKPYLGLPMYYLLLFFKRILLPDVQVRVTVMLQILIIGFCMFAAYMGYYLGYSKKDNKINIPIMQNARVLIGIVVILESMLGVLNGYGIFQVAVDVYKVVEILIFYYFLRYTLRTTGNIEKAFNIIILEMCVFGVCEIFTTERGGVGFNIAMSFFPIFFAVGFYEKRKKYWLITLCVAWIAMASQTRTYMMGLILSILIIFWFARGTYAHKNRIIGVCLGIVLVFTIVVGAVILKIPVFADFINRILELNEGFGEAGGYRIYEIQMALNKFLENPLFGKGYGYVEYLYIKLMGWFNWGDFMHNTYIEILCKTGIFGVGIYGFGMLNYIRNQLKKVRFLNEHYSKGKITGYVIGGFAATLSWILVYFAAPLTTYGYIFVPGMFSLLFYYGFKKEISNQE